MSFKGTTITKNDGGLGGSQTTDRGAVIIIGAAATDTVPNNKAYELLQIEDAESLGITPATDLSNTELVHDHLSEIFRLAPENRVYLITVPKATKVSDLKNLTELIDALRGIEGLNTIAVAGLAADLTLTAAVQGGQLVVDTLAAEHILIDSFLIEGLGSYNAGTIAEFTNLRTLVSPNVSVIIAQDPQVASRNAAYSGYAAVGAALGMLLARYVHENLGSVDIENKPRAKRGTNDYPLTDSKLGRWVSASLSNGKKFSELSYADQQKLDELGYIYAGSFAGYGGVFLSDSHTCEKADSDYCYIERNAIWNKAARIVRRILIPRIRSKVEAEPSTGYIKHTTITDWDGRVRVGLDTMKAAGNIADFDIYIDPKQAAVMTTPFRIRLRLVADGIVHEFDIDLGYTKSL